MTDTIAGPLADTLIWCREYMVDNSREPSMEELRAHFNLTIDNARRRVSLLAAKGLLKVNTSGRGQGRTLTARGLAMVSSLRGGAVTVTRTGPKPAEQPSRMARRYIGRLNAGWSLGKIAEHYGVSRTAVAYVRDRWFHLLKLREARADEKRATPRRGYDRVTDAQAHSGRLTRAR